jgi:three-Cys-motif partner protein
MIRRAHDGLRARVGGPWTREKLDYVGRYATAFMKAMHPKRRAGIWSELVYVDLLAEPGKGINRDGSAEFDGSPLRALKIDPPFDRLFLSDLHEKNVEALRRRIAPDQLHRVTLRVGDCNAIVTDVMASLTGKTLGLAFIDPEGFEVKFTVFEALARRRVDVLFLFPSGIGIARNLRAFSRQAHSPMDDFWGGREWRELPPARLAGGERIPPDEALSFDRPWVFAFRSKMAGLGFRYQDEGDPCLANEKNVPMYHLLFFSKDVAGLTIWRGIKKIEPGGQRTLF